jgi:hypothetical protein
MKGVTSLNSDAVVRVLRATWNTGPNHDKGEASWLQYNKCTTAADPSKKRNGQIYTFGSGSRAGTLDPEPERSDFCLFVPKSEPRILYLLDVTKKLQSRTTG